MDVKGTVTGFDDIDKAIQRLDKRKARNALRRATSQALQPAVKEARRLADQNVGRRTGEGRKNIKKRTLKKRERRSLGIDLGSIVFIDSDGFYLRFWELGFTRYGEHYAARPFLRPALDTQQREIIERFRARGQQIIEREAKKRGR